MRQSKTEQNRTQKKKQLQEEVRNEKRTPITRNKSNRSILLSTMMFLCIFLGMIAYQIYFQVTKADTVINNSHNKRQSIMEEKVQKGSIIDSDGNVLAATKEDENGNSVRYYPYKDLFAHTVGYLTMGGYGLEKQANYYMLQSNQNLFQQIKNDIEGVKNKGDNLYVSLDAGLSKACYDALGDNNGAIIVTEPDTGKILAMVSKPTFNPNTLDEDWDSIVADKNSSVLVNRATQGLYPPGSTFKIVTLLEYYREHMADFEKYQYTCEGSYRIGDMDISCANGKAHGKQDIFNSFANSCNTSFINMGLTLDYKKYKATAEELLFNKELPYDSEYSKSQFNLSEDSSRFDIAQTAFGQGQTLVTPLHLAMITSAIANDGVLNKPYMMERVESCDGLVVKEFKTDSTKLMTEDEAKFLQKGMKQVIEQSYKWAFEDADYSVSGKSGTAQYGTQGYEHSLFVSYSPSEKPEIAVTVIVEGSENRTVHAAKATRAIYDYYYKNK